LQFIFYFQQLEATQKALIPVQNDIISLSKLIAKISAPLKVEGDGVLAEFRKPDESMRDRLFVLQVWRCYDHDTADKLDRVKAGEFLDLDLAKVLESREKRLDREKREREKETSSSRPKHHRGGATYNGDSASGSHDSGGFHSTGRGGFGGRGGGARGTKRPAPDRTCFTCGKTGHFFKNCPDKKP